MKHILFMVRIIIWNYDDNYHSILSARNLTIINQFARCIQLIGAYDEGTRSENGNDPRRKEWL